MDPELTICMDPDGVGWGGGGLFWFLCFFFWSRAGVLPKVKGDLGLGFQNQRTAESELASNYNYSMRGHE
jgi:hypothetical protein